MPNKSGVCPADTGERQQAAAKSDNLMPEFRAKSPYPA